MSTAIPKINVFNRQRRLPVEIRPLQQFARRLSRRLELTQGWTVALISDDAMRRYHRTYAGRDGATDVLSFPYEAEPWEPPEESYAGDVLISVETADRQRRGSLERELKLLSLHGLLHLLGYDHASDAGEMDRLERTLREELELV